MKRIRSNFERLRYIDPAVPIPVGRWSRVEKRLGFPLPANYKRMIEVHGSSEWWGDLDAGGEVLTLLSPFARDANFNLFDFGGAMLQGYYDTFPEEERARFPYEFEMKVGGLLPWGVTSVGNLVCYLIKGDCEPGYPILFLEKSSGCEINYHLTCHEFAFRLVSQTLQSGILPPRKLDT